jgi:PAS domain S-box-containing protein
MLTSLHDAADHLGTDVTQHTDFYPHTDKAGNPTARAETATVRVLLIDDEEDSFIILRRLLSKVPRKNFHIDWTPTYDKGLAALERREHDVCLMDYRLPGHTGLELLAEAINRGVQTPVIMLTGQEDPQVDMEATQVGASDFLLKDHIEPVTLERVIRYSIQRAVTLKALQKSNERFRLLFERSMDAILISNGEGQFVEVNQAACRILGKTREQLCAMNWSDLAPNTPLPHRMEQSEALGELTFIKAGGERCFIEFASSQLAADLNLSILRDLTDRRNLEREIQEISEREQRRLGQDLHDGLGQSMTGIAFLAKVLQQKLSAKQVHEAEEAGNIATLINEALAQTRRLSRGLCPVFLETNDIEAALGQLTGDLRTLFGVDCRLQFDPRIDIQENEVAVHLYRIAQEAATNSIKHGRAKNISIKLALAGSRMVLRVSDDGVGFPKKPSENAGMGLRVMQHRARMIGARIEFRQPAGGGVTVTCSLGVKNKRQ